MRYDVEICNPQQETTIVYFLIGDKLSSVPLKVSQVKLPRQDRLPDTSNFAHL